MPRSTNKPSIFLACTQTDAEGGQSDIAAKECEFVSDTLNILIAQGGCQLIQARHGSKVYVEDIITNINLKKQIVIAQLSGENLSENKLHFSSRKGTISFTFDEFAKILTTIPRLQMVLLSGTGNTRFIEVLLAQGIPVVLKADYAFEKPVIAAAFFEQLLKGNGIQQSFENLTQIFQLGNSIQFARWNNNNQKLSWESGDHLRADELVLYVRRDKERSLKWRLRNPLLIPAHEKDRQSRFASLKLKPRQKPEPVKEAANDAMIPPAKEIEPTEKSKVSQESTAKEVSDKTIQEVFDKKIC